MKYAVLVRGTTYYLGSKLFEKGKKVPITEAEYDLLTDKSEGNAHGFDRIEVEGQEELRSKFEFSDDTAEPAAEGAEGETEKPVRSRRVKPDDTAS